MWEAIDVECRRLESERLHDPGTLDVRRGGDQLVDRCSAEGKNVRLTSKAAGKDRYKSKLKDELQGSNITFRDGEDQGARRELHDYTSLRNDTPGV